MSTAHWEIAENRKATGHFGVLVRGFTPRVRGKERFPLLHTADRHSHTPQRASGAFLSARNVLLAVCAREATTRYTLCPPFFCGLPVCSCACLSSHTPYSPPSLSAASCLCLKQLTHCTFAACTQFDSWIQLATKHGTTIVF